MLAIFYVFFVGGGELRTFSVLVFSMFSLLGGGGEGGRGTEEYHFYSISKLVPQRP